MKTFLLTKENLTDFDEYAQTYGKTTDNPMRKYIEKPSLLKVLDNIKHRSILDLACGEGSYARMFKRLGAEYVVGVDISAKMINIANFIETQQPLGIRYRVSDARSLNLLYWFDIITAIYLLPHAQTKEMLVGMCQSIYDNLRPGGRLVAVTSNPDITQKHLAAPGKLGVRAEMDGPARDGKTIVITYTDLNPPIRILNYHWDKETYESILSNVGFKKIKWHPIYIAEEGIEKYGKDYWQNYLEYPHLTVLECHK